MFNLTFEYKLKPTTGQEAIFSDWLEVCRRAYNYALGERKDWYKSRSCRIDACSLTGEYIIAADAPRPTYSSQCKALTQARKTNPQLARVQSQVLQQTLRRLEKAFVSMWEQGHGFPRFKKVGTMRSFVFPQIGMGAIENSTIKLPVIGRIKFRQSRPIPDGVALKQARILKRASGWFVMLTLQWDANIPQIMPHGEAVGIDVGILHFLATSSGKTYPNPRPFKMLQRKLRLLQKRVSRKVKGSSNRKKAQAKVSKLHEKIANIRKDYYWKLARELCESVGMVFVENLNLVGVSSRHSRQTLFGCRMGPVFPDSRTMLL